MKASLQRRINVASFWASTRISVLDAYERYDDSFAITEEFREWITCSSEYPEQLEASVIEVPEKLKELQNKAKRDSDEKLEI